MAAAGGNAPVEAQRIIDVVQQAVSAGQGAETLCFVAVSVEDHGDVGVVFPCPQRLVTASKRVTRIDWGSAQADQGDLDMVIGKQRFQVIEGRSATRAFGVKENEKLLLPRCAANVRVGWPSLWCGRDGTGSAAVNDQPSESASHQDQPNAERCEVA
ncbi:hypothetical protein C5Y97_23500 [Blastopirellula marina]|uniref:Uncharacterized protein n=1 Tax=Blastopirellula marina TaxID=124 RepID=A0A2S8F9C2_9BACT|nr:hypothetical protein C5Y98_23485 [Blastopirellula marina]PTL42020.1 hypothetical protein C5Y97_23500 [Blastopirellula marina]